MQIKTSKDAFEALIELYCNLCMTTDLADARDIIIELERVIEEVNTNYFFPIVEPIGVAALKAQENPITEQGRLSAAWEMYDMLGRLVFCFEEANIITMRPYMDALEYGRTFVPYEHAKKWGQAYTKPQRFSHETFYFAYLSQVYQKNEEEYQEYAQQLRKKIQSVRATFPKEKALPKRVYEKVQKDLNDKYQAYLSYINENYEPIKHLFSYYNKRIRLYLHSRNDKEIIALMNIYDSSFSECKVYPNEVNTMYRFHNYEAGSQRIVNGMITGLEKADYNLKYVFAESSIHDELNSIFVKYATESDLMMYVEYMLRGQMKHVKSTDQQDIVTIDGDKYNVFLNEEPAINKVKGIIRSKKRGIKGFLFRYAPYMELADFLYEKKIPYYSAEDLGVGLINNWNGEMIHLYIKERLSKLKVPRPNGNLPSSQLLINRLRNCPTGQEGWVEYENIGTDIFKYLFADDFRHFSYKVQSDTEDGILRRDLIIPNTYDPNLGFWRHVENQYNAKVIIVDFKNFSDPLNLDEFYKVSKYFDSLKGNFAIIFSRKGLNKNARRFQMKRLGEHELVLCLTDEDIIEMIELKDRNQSPTDLLENIYYALCEKG